MAAEWVLQFSLAFTGSPVPARLNRAGTLGSFILNPATFARPCDPDKLEAKRPLAKAHKHFFFASFAALREIKIF
jgi:hypothetical protein